MPRDLQKKRLTARDLQAAERREQLLQAAKELFARQGFHATSTRSITQRVGMADGLIYHYFPEGKLEMLDIIVREGHEKRIGQMELSLRALDDELPLRDVLMAFARQVYQNLKGDPELILLQLRERSLLSAERSEYLTESILRNQQWLADFLERRAQRGEIRMMDFKLAARQFVSAIGFQLFQELLGLDVIEGDKLAYLEQMADFTIRLWMIEQ